MIAISSIGFDLTQPPKVFAILLGLWQRPVPSAINRPSANHVQNWRLQGSASGHRQAIPELLAVLEPFGTPWPTSVRRIAASIDRLSAVAR